MANRITTVLEFVGADKATNQVKNLGKEFQKAEGFSAKAKIAAKGFGDVLRNNVAEIATATGTALVAFGAKAAKAFQDSALEAKNLATLTGDTVEESSRLNAIWKQSGADAKDLQDVLLQMNGVLSTNKELVKELGINLNDGATVGERFQQVSKILDGIEDSAKRSQMASQLFGEEGVRQYNALRNAVGDVGDAMDRVSDAQAIDEDEVRKAERLRDVTIELKKELTDFALIAGEEVADKVVRAKEVIDDLTDAMESLPFVDSASDVYGFVRVLNDAIAPLNRFFEALEWTTNTIDDLVPSEKKLKDNLLEGTKATIEAAYATAELNAGLGEYDGAADRAAARVARHTEATEEGASAQSIIADAIADATEEFDRQEDAANRARDAMRDHADAVHGLHDAEFALKDAIEASNEQMAEAIEAGDETTESMESIRAGWEDVADAADRAAQEFVRTQGVEADSVTGQRMWAEQMLKTAGTLDGEMRDAVMAHIERVTGIPANILTTFGVEVDPGSLAALEDLLARLGRVSQNRFATVSAVGTRGGARVDGPNTGRRVEGARGAIVTQRTNADIGEDGPEAVIPLDKMPGASPLPDLGGGSDVKNVTIHIHAMGTTPELERVVANALARYNQRNGR